MGKVLLACMPLERMEEMLASCDMRAFTYHTITDREVLRKELSVIRKRGYGCDVEEYIDGTSCIAFPIFDDKNKICGCHECFRHSGPD